MKTLLYAMLAALAIQQTTSPRTPKEIADDMDKLSAEVRALQPVAPADLQAALNKGGEIHLQGGTIYPGNFVIRANDTKLYFDGASFTGSKVGPALEIPPDTANVEVYDFVGTTDYDQQVILCGHNDGSQTTVGVVPSNIKFVRTRIPTYRGKRGIEVNCTDTEIIDATVTDLFDPAGRDSQCIWIGNTPGSVWVHGVNAILKLSGATETFMVGGDTLKIPGAVRSSIYLENFSLDHPLDWFNSTTKHYVKNLLELKECHQCVIRNGTLDGVWKDAQSGWAIMVTPRNGGSIDDALFENLMITHAAGIIATLGLTDVAPPTPVATQKIVLRNITATAAKMYSTSTMGVFGMFNAETHDVTLEGVKFVGDGNYFISTSAEKPLDPVTGLPRPGGPMTLLSVTGSTFTAGIYGFFLNGSANAPPTQTGVTNLVVTGNTISGAAAALKKNLPQNTYL